MDNIEINSSNVVKSWQKYFDSPQTIFLNNATIVENIAIGQTFEIDLEKVVRSAKFAKIDQYIENYQ